MAQEATVLAARSVQISTIISKIATLEGQIRSMASSDTTNEMILVLEKLKKNVQDVLDAYAAVMKNKPIAYQRKYASKSAVTGANEAIESISSIQQALALAEACNKNRTNHADDEYAVVYKIQPGDTLSELAKKYNVSVDELCRLNNIKNRNLIRAGADLLIPISLPAGMALPMMISGIPLKHIGNNSSANNASSASNSNAAKNGATTATNSQANTTPSTPTQSTTTSGTGKFTVTQTGDKTVYQYDVKTQKQSEYSRIPEDLYPNKQKPNATVASAGCGPSSLASCINALEGKEVTDPRGMCAYSKAHGARSEVDGTIMEKLIDSWCADNPDYHNKCLYRGDVGKSSPDTINQLIQSLKEGKVATIGTRPNNGSYFSNGGHIVAATGVEVSKDGAARLIISDPNMDVHNWNNYSGAEIIGDKVYIDINVAKKYIGSIYIISK